MKIIQKVKDLEIGWFLPHSGKPIEFDDILSVLKCHTKNGGNIFVGTDRC